MAVSYFSSERQGTTTSRSVSSRWRLQAYKNDVYLFPKELGDNDNDNDTLREVPHQSNEGLALQARVSGPWPLKKESVLLGKLAHWQGVQVQTVMDRV